MISYLIVAPENEADARRFSAPAVHMAYAIGADGALMRRTLPPDLRGGLMGLPDPPDEQFGEALIQSILTECTVRHYGGVWCDFERSTEARRSFLSALGDALAKSGKCLYAPSVFPIPNAVTLVDTAISGGTLQEYLSWQKARHARLALNISRLCMDFPLPCTGGKGLVLSGDAFRALYERYGTPSYFSAEFYTRYFTYFAGDRGHLVLFDDAETMRRKRELGCSLGIDTAFFAYPEVCDCLPQLFAVKKENAK